MADERSSEETSSDVSMPDDFQDHAADEPIANTPDWLALPLKIWQHIMKSLRPAFERHASTIPHPSGKPSKFNPSRVTSSNRDYLSLGLTCKYLGPLALRELNRMYFISSDEHLTKILAWRREHGCSLDFLSWLSGIKRPRALHVSGDRLAQHRSKETDQVCRWISDARRLLSLCRDAVYISLRVDTADLLFRFLEEDYGPVPLRLVLSAASPLGLYTFTMRMGRYGRLRKLTHLHLINVVPSSALISLLVGYPIPAHHSGDVGNLIARGGSRRRCNARSSKLDANRFAARQRLAPCPSWKAGPGSSLEPFSR